MPGCKRGMTAPFSQVRRKRFISRTRSTSCAKKTRVVAIAAQPRLVEIIHRMRSRTLVRRKVVSAALVAVVRAAREHKGVVVASEAQSILRAYPESEVSLAEIEQHVVRLAL
jgi:hypothetical protein